MGKDKDGSKQVLSLNLRNKCYAPNSEIVAMMLRLVVRWFLTPSNPHIDKLQHALNKVKA
jgi:hypothetical protein